MTREEIETKIHALVAQELEVPLTEVRSTAVLVDDLHADSLALMSLALEVEDTFDVEHDLQLLDIRTVGDIVERVVEERAAAAAPNPAS